MNSLNKVQLIGNITADPEVRQTPNGQFVANFSLVTNRTWKDAAGIKQEQSEFHNIVIWGKLAEIVVEQYIKKGMKVYVEGRLQTRSWEDQTGVKKYKTEVISDNIIMLGSPAGKDEGNSFSTDYSNDEMTSTKIKKSNPKQEEEINIEDIPF